jgi:rod shape-determining protein MreD
LLRLTLQLYPWSGKGIILRPDFLLVVTLYWVLRAPILCNVGIAWFAGLMVDLSTGSLLGQHALSFAFTAFLGINVSATFSLVQSNGNSRSMYFALLITSRVIVLMLKLFADNENPGLSYFWPVITSLIFGNCHGNLWGTHSPQSLNTMAYSTELKNHQNEQHNFRVRLSILAFVMMALFLVWEFAFIICKFNRTIIIRRWPKTTASRLCPFPQPRSNFRPKRYIVLAHNFFVYTLEITPSKVAH